MDISDYFDKPTEAIRPTALMASDESLDRQKARELTRLIVREKELDEESLLPSGDDHISKMVNRPLLDMVKTLEQRNIKLLEIMSNGSVRSAITPGEAAKELRENTEILLSIKKSVSSKDSGTTVNVDVGSIFKEATLAAKAAAEAESNHKEILVEKVEDGEK